METTPLPSELYRAGNTICVDDGNGYGTVIASGKDPEVLQAMVDRYNAFEKLSDNYKFNPSILAEGVRKVEETLAEVKRISGSVEGGNHDACFSALLKIYDLVK
jgi:hypothetical protein